MSRILLIEDNTDLAEFVARGLSQEGFAVDILPDGMHALQKLADNAYGLVILDRRLPSGDGTIVCKAIKSQYPDVRVLMLTASAQLVEKIEGFKSGADDYLTKPFEFEELLMRVHALIRRSAAGAAQSTLATGNLSLNRNTKEVWRGTREIKLTAKEFQLLSILMENAGEVVSRARILSNVWKLNFDPGTKIVDVYVRYLRQKVDGNEEKQLIINKRGFGYLIAKEQ
jgi:two-component system, OmpR family, response regulator